MFHVQPVQCDYFNDPLKHLKYDCLFNNETIKQATIRCQSLTDILNVVDNKIKIQ